MLVNTPYSVYGHHRDDDDDEDDDDDDDQSVSNFVCLVLACSM